MKRPERHPRWPLLLVAISAGVATWSGWVELGKLTGFGIVHPLPGIADGFSINSAIVLPLGVEAYSAYALGAYLTSRRLSEATRRFARKSALGSLVLGLLGQIAYHLLAAAQIHRAPWWVTTAVACIPVIMLGLAASLSHMISRDSETVREDRTEQQPYGPDRTAESRPAPDTTGQDRPAADGSGQDRTAADEEEQEAPDDVRDRTDPDGRPDTEPRTGVRTVQMGQVRPLVDRAAVVTSVAREIRAAGAAGKEWRPDYPGLTGRTGYGRSWAERVVRDARAEAARTGESRTGTEGI